MPTELRFTVTGRVALPDDVFERAKAILATQARMGALREAIEQEFSGEVTVSADEVTPRPRRSKEDERAGSIGVDPVDEPGGVEP